MAQQDQSEIELKRSENTVKTSVIVVSVILAVLVIVIIVLACVFLAAPSSANVTNAIRLKDPSGKPPSAQKPHLPGSKGGALVGGTLPFTIADNMRLIVKASQSNGPASTYFIYKYPSGVYTDLPTLVAALNATNNFTAIYFDSVVGSWFINANLGKHS
jgi:hypothetical protein